MGNHYVFGVNAQNLMSHLRHRGFHALSVALNAYAKFQSAVWREPDRRLFVTRHHCNAPARKNRGAVCRLFDVGTHANTDYSTIICRNALARPDLLQTNHIYGHFDAFRIIPAVEVFFCY